MADSTCRWEAVDCKFDGTDKCAICFTVRQFYKQKTVKKKQGLRQRAQRADKRQGSAFEAANHKRNVADIRETESAMTVNSGATRRQKGDENITGYIRVAEELKTQMPDRAKGTKSFTIQRSWLDKLHQESLQHNQEFWYLVFAFSENEGVNPAGDTFVISEKEMIFNMVQTMISDRKKADIAAQQLDVAMKETEMVRADNAALLAKIRYLEAQLQLAAMGGFAAAFEHPLEEEPKKGGKGFE